jgi:ATP-dependent RNA helicase RhlB
MNLADLGLHEGLSRAIEARGLDSLYPFLEKTVEHVNRKKENVAAQVRLGAGRESVYLVPMLQWLLTEGEGQRALVILPTEQDVATVMTPAQVLAEAVGLPVHALGHDPDAADATAALSLAAVEVLSARHESATLDLLGYGFVVVDGVERFTESPWHGHLLQVRTYLRPAWERRTMIVADKLGTKEQTLALDLADAPTELYLEEEAEKVKHVPQATWYVASDAKLRLLLGVLAREARTTVAVFCNLRESAEEVARRLSTNGKRVEYILGNLPQPRKDSILARARSGEIEAVVLTDEGARGLTQGFFPLIINFDIPLEGEPYLDRVRLLDIGSADARIINFACDRYVYGIPAVEQFMGISLGAVQADDALYAAIDKSAGMTFSHGNRQEGRGGSRDGGQVRNGQDGGRQPSRGRERSELPGGYGNRRDSDGYRHDGRSRERGPDPRYQESIRAGIAELTGVGLSGSGARNHPQVAPRPQIKQERDFGEGNPRSSNAQHPNTGHPGSGNTNRPEGRRGHRRNKHGRQGGASSGAPGVRGVSPSAAFEDPYAIPIEERMRLYKEKYGKRLAEESPQRSSGRKKSRRHGSGSPGAAPATGSPEGQSPRSEGPRNPDPRPVRPVDRSEAPSVPNQGHPSDAGGDGHGGLFGKLFGGMRKDKE